MMGNPATWSVSVDVGIGAGVVVLVGIAFCIINHQMNKRKAKKTPIINEQKLMQMNSREYLVGKNFEGDMSVLERDRSRAMANSPALSYVLAPATAVVDWSDSKSTRSARSVSSSLTELPWSRDGSVASMPAMPRIPSPMRLSPSDAPLNRTSTASSFGGAYMPPLPPPRSARRPQANSAWISPLDVHFSRPQSPTSRPQSYLPGQVLGRAKSALLVPTPAGSIGGAVKSEAASIISSNFATAPPDPPRQKSPTFNFNFFDSEVPTRPPQHSTRSITPPPNSPQNCFGPKSQGLDHGESAIIRLSVGSKRSVSIYQSPTQHTGQTPSHHSAASSIYSTISISRPVSPSQAIPQSDVSHPVPQQPKARSRSRSTSSKRPISLSQTQNSLRRLSRQSISEKRRSRDRDQIHYDPTSHHRNRSGSVQGRAVDFDRPRESPFSQADATNPVSHSKSSSLDTSEKVKIDTGVRNEGRENRGLNVGLEAGAVDTNRLSTVSVSKRGRSASETSQASIGFGDFYDAYYRQSQASRLSHASVASHILNVSKQSSQDSHVSGVGVAVTSNGMKRPPPLKFGGAQVEETIVEVATPISTPGLVMGVSTGMGLGIGGWGSVGGMI